MKGMTKNQVQVLPIKHLILLDVVASIGKQYATTPLF